MLLGVLLASLERCRSALQLYLTVEVLTSEWHHLQRKLGTLLCPCAGGRRHRPHPWSLLRPRAHIHLPTCVHHAQPLLQPSGNGLAAAGSSVFLCALSLLGQLLQDWSCWRGAFWSWVASYSTVG